MFSQATVQSQNLITAITAGLTLPQGESNPSVEVSIVNAFANGVNKVTLPTLANGIIPSGWRIYRGTSVGSETYLTTLPGDTNTFFDDGTAVGTISAPPSASYGYMGSIPLNIGTLTTTNPGTAYLDLSFSGTTSTQVIAGDTWAWGQPFIANATNIDSIDLPIDFHGNPTGITVAIYPEIYTLPNSTQGFVPSTYTVSGPTTPIATSTVNLPQVNKFGTTGQYTHFQFSTPATLVKGQMYYVVVSVSNAANNGATGNYFFWYGSFGGAALTNCINRVVYGYGYQVFGANGSTNGAGNQAWINAFTGSFGYKINAQGTLSPATYYYVATACTGFVEKGRISTYDSQGFSHGNVYFCAGDGTAKFYPILFVSNGNRLVYCGMYEKYDNQTHLIPFLLVGFQPSINGTAVANQNYVYNATASPIYVNASPIPSSGNVTFRLHTYNNYFYLNLVGDSANVGFQEGIVFVGMPTPLGPADKPYVVSGNSSSWLELRDFGNNVNQALYPLGITNSTKLFSNGQNNDAFPYYNSYTGNNDGVTLSLADSYGVRTTMPGLILLPHGSSSTINNHDTFVVNGATYILYQTVNYSGDGNSYRPFSIWSFGYGGLNLLTDYYPAIQIS